MPPINKTSYHISLYHCHDPANGFDVMQKFSKENEFH